LPSVRYAVWKSPLLAYRIPDVTAAQSATWLERRELSLVLAWSFSYAS
jgi:hypothetical protein